MIGHRIFLGSGTKDSPLFLDKLPDHARNWDFACCGAQIHAQDAQHLLLSRRRPRSAHSLLGPWPAWVDLAEVQRLVRDPEHRGLRIRETTVAICTSEPVARALVQQGHIRTTAVRNPATRQEQVVVMPSEVKAFREKFILGVASGARAGHAPDDRQEGD